MLSIFQICAYLLHYCGRVPRSLENLGQLGPNNRSPDHPGFPWHMKSNRAPWWASAATCSIYSRVEKVTRVGGKSWKLGYQRSVRLFKNWQNDWIQNVLSKKLVKPSCAFRTAIFIWPIWDIKLPFGTWKKWRGCPPAPSKKVFTKCNI